MPVFKAFLIAAVLVSATYAQTPAPTAADREAARKIAQLARVAKGNNELAAMAALREMATLGEPARAELTAAARFCLDRDERLLRRASASSVQRLASMQTQMDAQREKAWAVIDKLDKSTVPQARANYNQLMPMQAEIGRAYGQLAPIAVALGRRDELLTMWRPGASEQELATREASEPPLLASAEEALGMTAAEARTCLAPPGRDDGGNPILKGLRHFIACRAIDGFNAQQAQHLNRQEQSNAAMVNAYREALGILPMEWDPRLIQSSRRHSKEMAELGFFGHESPTPENKTHTMRMRNAGHPNGIAENCAMGNGSGEATFWQWFDSPGHHKNMVGRTYIGLGVGKWGTHWTQNMAGGRRLTWMTPQDLAGIEVKGEIVRPQ
jgi:uncharacterized protein YkwD